MPDYAEVASCSTFKNATQSPLYDSFGAYATTNVVRNVNMFTNSHYPPTGKSTNSVYSAPTICHFNPSEPNGSTTRTNYMHSDANIGCNFSSSSSTSTSNPKHATNKMNIIENKMDAINNLNRSTTSVHGSPANSSILTDTTMVSIKSVPSTPIIGMNQSGTNRRNRLPKIGGHCDKISFGGNDNGRNIEQPLFIKSKEDGSWTSVQNASYHFQNATNSSVNSTNFKNGIGDTNKYKINASNNSINNLNNSQNLNNSPNNITNHVSSSSSAAVAAAAAAAASSNPIHFSSFGRADNV